MRKIALVVGALFWISNLATIIGSVIAGAVRMLPLWGSRLVASRSSAIGF